MKPVSNGFDDIELVFGVDDAISIDGSARSDAAAPAALPDRPPGGGLEEEQVQHNSRN